MDAMSALRGLMDSVDAQRWDELGQYLHASFSCEYSHTGETFDRQAWIRLNADYPGFDRLRIDELVGNGTAAACRSHVTSRRGTEQDRFACATIIQMHEGLIHRMTEVWTDIAQTPPPGGRSPDA